MNLHALAPILAVALASCSAERASPFFESEALGVHVEGVSWVNAKRAHGGATAHEITGRVSVAGKGAREVSVRAESDRAELGGAQRLAVVDTETGESRTFTFDRASNGLTIGAGASSVSVITNPDGSYTVDGVPAADRLEMLALLDESPVYTEASEHVVAMAYAVARQPSPRGAVRNSIDCNFNSNTGGRGVFDCAVCDKLHADECAPCPEALDNRTRRNHDVRVDRDGTLTIKNTKAGAKFKHLIVKDRSGEVSLGGPIIKFSYPANHTRLVDVDGVSCKDNDEVLKVLLDRKAEVTVAEIDAFLQDHGNKHFDFKLAGQNEAFRDLVQRWRKRLAAEPARGPSRRE